jgi:hypothetical protein
MQWQDSYERWVGKDVEQNGSYYINVKSNHFYWMTDENHENISRIRSKDTT